MSDGPSKEAVDLACDFRSQWGNKPMIDVDAMLEALARAFDVFAEDVAEEREALRRARELLEHCRYLPAQSERAKVLKQDIAAFLGCAG